MGLTGPNIYDVGEQGSQGSKTKEVDRQLELKSMAAKKIDLTIEEVAKYMKLSL